MNKFVFVLIPVMALGVTAGATLAAVNDQCGHNEAMVQIGATTGGVVGSIAPGVGTAAGVALGAVAGCVLDERGPAWEKAIHKALKRWKL